METEDPSDVDDADLEAALTKAVTPVTSVDPEARSDDLDVIAATMAEADVIGLGEASHGTHEFFRFKHRLFRHLAEHHGVRLLAFEANFAALLAVNEYVMWGEGTARAALEQDSIHPCYRGDEIVALLEWVRDFNESRPESDRIRVHGFDIQCPAVAATRLETYFETVDPAVADDVRTDLSLLVEDGIPNLSDETALGRHLEARTAVSTTLGDVLAEREETYVEATSRTAYERANRLVWMIEQGRRQFEAIFQGRTKTGANVRIRDSAMAAQVRWLLGHEPAEQIVLWGHNAHLTRGAFGGGTGRHRQGIPSLGHNLAGLTSIDYYALGLLLGGGSVRAAYVPDGEYRTYEIEEPPAGSLPDVFGRIDPSVYVLDVANLPSESPLTEWLDSRPLHYDIEGGYRDTPVNLVESNVRQQFDGLVFIEETTAANW